MGLGNKKKKETVEDHLLQVTFRKDEGWNIDFGPEMSKYADETKVVLAGKLLSQLGTRLLTSRVVDEDEHGTIWDDEEEED